MTIDKLASMILNKCEIYYGDSLISKECIIEKYISFFAGEMDATRRSVSFALHTGSKCFDIVSIVVAALGCMSYNLLTNDDILLALQLDDMVMYKGQRYRWKGIQQRDAIQCMVLEQDGRGKNGKTVSWIPYEKNKHLVKPYYGTSLTTDGRGIRRAKTNREDFLSYIFELESSEIPSQFEVSVVIVAEKNAFYEICKDLRIVYGDKKEVGLLDIVPASYFTSSGEELQYGTNPTKAEPVLKVASRVSMARKLVLNKRGSKVVGLLVTGTDTFINNNSEVEDLLRRKSLNFIHVTTPFRADIGIQVLESYAESALFACTKEFLSENAGETREQNDLVVELNRQISNIVNKKTSLIEVGDGWSWNEYCTIRRGIYQLRQSDWRNERKEEFILTAHGLLNLFTTAIFTMEQMEMAIEQEKIKSTVQSPAARISVLWDISEDAGEMMMQCATIADALESMYKKMFNCCPKLNAVQSYIESHSDNKIVIVVPKAYYVDLFKMTLEQFEDVICVTANRFDPILECDAVLSVGEISGKNFDPLQCQSAEDVVVFLYEYEKSFFNHRSRKLKKVEKRLNSKIKGSSYTEPEEELPQTEDTVDEATVQEFYDLEEYIDQLNMVSLSNMFSNYAGTNGNSPSSEVQYVGVFTTGERIFFSKYYTAVVFDKVGGCVIEKTVDKLAPGDQLIFTNRDEYTRNIVDILFDRLLASGKLNPEVVEASEKAWYWKEALKEYREKEKLTYRDFAKKFKELGSTLQEATIRQWVTEDSHIVGPRAEKTMEYIAQITQDPYLLSDVHGHFEACRIVRHERRKILKLIGKAINEKLIGRIPDEGSLFEIIFNNVDNLSKILELDSIMELEKSTSVSISWVNRPIEETEVLS